MQQLGNSNPPKSSRTARQNDPIYKVMLLVAYALLSVVASGTVYWLIFSSPFVPLQRVEFNVAVSGSASWTPQEAFKELKASQLVRILVNDRNEQPYWAYFPEVKRDTATDLELDSRHLVQAACFSSTNFSILGEANRDARSGSMRSMRKGFRVQLPKGEGIICQLSFVGPSRFSASIWDHNLANEAQDDFQRTSGLLDGAVLMLAVFACVLGVFSKSPVLFLYAVWMIACSRLASSSVGMDFAWLGWDIPAVALSWTRKGAVLSYVTFSVSLVHMMFVRELRALKLNRTLVQAQWATLVVSCCTVWLPYGQFLPYAWALAFGTAVVGLYSIVQVVRLQASSTAWVYFGGWCFAIVSQFGEVIAGVLGIESLNVLTNSVTSSLMASFLVAASLAEKVRKDRIKRSLDRHRTVEALELVKRTYLSVPLGLFTVTKEGTILRNNPTFESMLKLRRVSGVLNWQQVGSHLPIQALLAQALRENASFRLGDRTFRLRAVAVKDAFECSIADVTTETNSVEKLSYLADHDELTDVMNRRGLNAWIDACNLGRRWGENITFAYVDLKRFKLINELYGYSAGDVVLKEVANRIKYAVRYASNTVARLGGDEFLVIFEGKNEVEISAAANRIVRLITDTGFEYQEKRFYIEVSVGLLTIDSSLNFVDALSAADAACGNAKSTKERLFWATKDEKHLERYRADQEMARAFEEHLPVDRFYIEFQPIVSLLTPSKDLSAEVLIRMRGEGGKPISPGLFIPTAERHGLMSQIDWWVLNQTTNWLVKNIDSMKAMNYIAVNLNGASLNDEAFLDKVSDFMQDHRAIGNKILFEITESVAMTDIGNTIKFVNRMKELGVRIGLDDFGAGYTSFGYLQEFPADVLKLDGEFVRQANIKPHNHRIIRSIADLSHQLGMKCVAEWAENATLVRTLHDLGADYAQGWGLCASIDPGRFVGVTNGLQLVRDPEVVAYLKMVDREAEKSHPVLISP